MVRRMREMLAFLWVVMVVMVVGCEKADLAKHCHLSGCNAGIANDRCCLEIYQCKSACGQSTMCSELNKIDLREFAENRVKPLNKIYRREFAVKCKTPPGYDAITVPCPPPDQKRTSGQQGASKGQTTAKPSQNSAPTGQQGASKGQTTAKPSQNSAPTRQRGTSKVRSTEESSRNSARRNQVALLIPPNSVSFTAAAHSGDDEIGGHIFDFLFAAQDVSTSSLPWAVTLLDSHPDVLAKIREEQDRIRLPGSDARAGFITPEQLREMKYTEMEDKEVVRFRPPGSDARAGFIMPEQLREMKYTEMVAKEVVRFRPPAPLVPHIAGEEFPIADKYTVPKGAIVFPSVLESSFEGFTEADRFDPERFNESRQENLVFKRSFLALGAGPHRCVG